MGWMGFVRQGDLGILGVLFAVFAGVFDPHMLDPLEAAGDVLDLPTRFLADLLTHLAAAGAGLLVFRQVVYLAGDRQVIEGRQVPPATANPANGLDLRFGSHLARKILRIHRPRFQLLGERQQHLGHVARRLEPVGTRAVVPLLQTKQFSLSTQELDVPIVTLRFARWSRSLGEVEDDLLQALADHPAKT